MTKQTTVDNRDVKPIGFPRKCLKAEKAFHKKNIRFFKY